MYRKCTIFTVCAVVYSRSAHASTDDQSGPTIPDNDTYLFYGKCVLQTKGQLTASMKLREHCPNHHRLSQRIYSDTVVMSTDIGDDEVWERALDSDSRMYWVNHRKKTTQWLHPFIKEPASFAVCSYDQLPYGWEKLYDPKIGKQLERYLELSFINCTESD